MTAGDFILVEVQEEKEKRFKELQNARIVSFLNGKYDFEEGEVLLGLENFYDVSSTLNVGETHKWSELETKITIFGYLNSIDCEVISKRLSNIPLTSIKMKYHSCFFLDKCKVKDPLKVCSKLHCEVWNSIKNTI